MKFPRRWTNHCAELLRAFNNKGVQYLLIGSMAKSFHCSELDAVDDMDLMVNSTQENVRKVLSVLRSVPHAVDPAELTLDLERKLVEEGKHMLLFTNQHDPHGDVHILTPPKEDFSFLEAAERSTEELIRGLDIRVQVASLRDLEMLDSLRKRAQRPESEGAHTAPGPNSQNPGAAGDIGR